MVYVKECKYMLKEQKQNFGGQILWKYGARRGGTIIKCKSIFSPPKQMNEWFQVHFITF